LKIAGILFDKDGTLVDFDRTWKPAYHRALDEFCQHHADPGLKTRCLTASGYDVEREITLPNSPLAVEGSDDVAAIWLAEAGLKRDEETILHLVGIMENVAADRPVPLFDVAALFARLAERGMTLGIATMDAEWVARRMVEQMSAEKHISFYAGYDSGFGRKPGPGMAREFCAVTGLAPEEIMVVGDNRHDLDMARNAGAGLAVGVCSGTANHEDLAEFADHVIEDATGVEQLLT
jgi:phosphoglycolate phosphatase